MSNKSRIIILKYTLANVGKWGINNLKLSIR